MALPIIYANSFKGIKKLFSDQSVSDLIEDVAADVVDEWVKLILSDAAFIDIRDNNKYKWNDLLDGVDWVDSSDIKRTHKGLTDVLRCITYFEYTKNPIQHNSSGFTVHKGANSEIADTAAIYAKSSGVYNDGSQSLNCEIYPFIEFYSSITTPINSFVDNGLESYTILTSSTKYLDNGDSVTINGIDYIVSNLSADVSFDITAVVGLTFSGDFTYKPFTELNLPNLGIIA